VAEVGNDLFCFGLATDDGAPRVLDTAACFDQRKNEIQTTGTKDFLQNQEKQ
jgi:hypothetical protein